MSHTTFSSAEPPHISGASSRLRVEPNDVFFRDSDNRAWLLRGINLSGSCKFPRYPVPVPSHVRGDAFLKPQGHPESSNATVDDHSDHISFVGRPFELDRADEHLARLRHWGFKIIRWVVTWEAIEHQGPGIYDQEFLDYTILALLKTKEYGFKVMIDFHQDVWSRFSGGSGAPLWTFHIAGLDPHHFAATGAAVVHNTLLEDEPLQQMVWLTNYYKLACASMFTLFYAGRLLAPKCTFNSGTNIQDFLQSHFLGAIEALVQKIHDCKDKDGNPLLEDHVVIGYDSWNEPSCGWIGLERLDVLSEEHDMRQGDMPTPLQSLMLGEGLTVRDIATYRIELVGPVKSGSRIIDPSAHPSSQGKPVKAWLSPVLRDRYDSQYGVQRDATFPKAGVCLWAQHGVWSIQDGRVLQQDYFSRVPPSTDTSSETTRIRWVDNHWLPFARQVIDLVRKIHSTAILFLEPPVYVPPPDLFNTISTSLPETGHGLDGTLNKELVTNMAYAPHHYDDLVLLTRRYLGWINLDLLGLSRGRQKSLLGSFVFGKKSTQTLFRNQIVEIQKECYERLGQRPVLIGETGLHFDVGMNVAQQRRNGTESAGNRSKIWSLPSWLRFSWNTARNGTNLKPSTGSTKISYRPPTKQFQRAFDNILEGLESTLVHYTLWNYTIENDTQYGDGWNGENLSIFSADAARMTTDEKDSDSDSDIYGGGVVHKLDRGGRAIEQFCRPYPVATVGYPIEVVFNRHENAKTFTLRTKTAANDGHARKLGSTANLKTEIFVPNYHFHGPEHCSVTVSDGTWEWNQEQQTVLWSYGETNSEPEAINAGYIYHRLEIRRRV
ncbi:hypothetical protein BX616_006408 [Lobosporangium transversale]|uniref:Glycoside hydrolase superfamily n=1 Tax=Lobosporangium transversale TaxID=64571 RepID=A0A1Y2GBT7_9FUNG|nr:glycoside hydrolase superfamily [Lobosporangium transversale]KAF9915322.1 hypothetical protein BX616_006408 [Lobosporangium transversale]ORZ06554.1 glycoside hydrolase superfamily [Lobosporangium transversale]|eukprot:XP_021877597.1 glycoside hydrolase superfamily [Lobosporangium transversale]